MNITIHEINETNLQDAVRIYNSNEDFLRHHLAVSRIDEAFIRNEIKEMHDNGFVSTLIKLDGEAVAIMDYMPPRDGNVYLSLLMLINTKQGSETLTWGQKTSQVVVMKKLL